MRRACLVLALALVVTTAGPTATAQTAAAAVSPAAVTLAGFWQAVWSYFSDEAAASNGNPDPCPDCDKVPPPPVCEPEDPDCRLPVPPPDN